MERNSNSTAGPSFASKFKEFDAKEVAKNRFNRVADANPPLEQPFSTLIGLPDEILSIIILYSGIFCKSSLARCCKKLYFMLDFKMELQMYQSVLQSLRRQDYKLKQDLEYWFKKSLKLRACAFDDISYLHACFGPDIFATSPNPLVQMKKASEHELQFDYVFNCNALTIFDYLLNAYENLEKNNKEEWKFMRNEAFQSFLWVSVSSLENKLVIDSKPVTIEKGSIIDKIMLVASKYSYILLRIILSDALATSLQLLSNLLQHKEMYPFNLTGVCPYNTRRVSLGYKVEPLEWCCYKCLFPHFKVLAEHTPLSPSIGYIAALAQSRVNNSLNPEFFDELVAKGADVNASLNPLLCYRVGVTTESALGVACFALRVFQNGPIVFIEWLLSHKAKFSANELAEIEQQPGLKERLKDVLEITSNPTTDYIPVSIPINNWQGPTLELDPTNVVFTEPYASFTRFDPQREYTTAVLHSITFFSNQHCVVTPVAGHVNYGGPEVHYNCTWKTNENDNVITFHAHSMVSAADERIDLTFDFRVFRGFNGKAVLVSEEHLKQRGDNGTTLVWLYGVIGTYKFEKL